MRRTLPLRWHHEAGAVLVVGMLMLVLLTVIGLAATTTGSLESEISGNEKLYQQAFYAAEISLVSAESSIEALLSRVDLQEGTTPGHYPQNSVHFDPASHQMIRTQDGMGDAVPPQPMRWDASDSIGIPIPSGLQGVATAPRYIIEERRFQSDSLGTGITYGRAGIYYFNVIARGTGGRDAAHTLLETVYAKRF